MQFSKIFAGHSISVAFLTISKRTPILQELLSKCDDKILTQVRKKKFLKINLVHISHDSRYF